MNTLVVEDEPKTAACLRQGLKESGLNPDVASDGADGLYLATTGDYQLILLDVLLPHCDGWTILAALRRTGRKTPVIVLTACDSAEDRARGREFGVADYLVKPVAFSDLMGHVRAALDSGQSRQPDWLQIADLRIDLLRREVERAGRRVELAPKEFELLALLARHAGTPVSHRTIAEQVWGVKIDSDAEVIDTAVRRLRRKVDEPFGKTLIHCVRGVGYVVAER